MPRTLESALWLPLFATYGRYQKTKVLLSAFWSVAEEYPRPKINPPRTCKSSKLRIYFFVISQPGFCVFPHVEPLLHCKVRLGEVGLVVEGVPLRVHENEGSENGSIASKLCQAFSPVAKA